MTDNNYDWERFRIHFICGAAVGAMIGAAVWMREWHPGMSGWLWIGGLSLAVGLLGGVYGDRFWEWFLENLRWLLWW